LTPALAAGSVRVVGPCLARPECRIIRTCRINDSAVRVPRVEFTDDERELVVARAAAE
jgi:hypothetical protein